MESIDKAIEVIGNRRCDEKLVSRAKELLNNTIPEQFVDADQVPVCFAPHVAGGTKAEVEFAREVSASPAQPVWTSYVEDLFTTRNPAKVNHWRPQIAWPKGQQTRQWIVPKDVQRQEGRPVGTAPTVFSGENAPATVKDYQSNLANIALELAGLSITPTVIDYSEWYQTQSGFRGMKRCAEGYYPAVMALYSVFGVLFRYDNQPGNEEILEFRQKVTRPAAEYVMDILKVEPIIIARDYPANGACTDLSKAEGIDPFAANILPPVVK